MDAIDILSAISVLNRDNAKRFTETKRLDAITSLLWNSKYRRINADGLFHLYAKKPLTSLSQDQVIVVSTHVDCERHITECFFEDIGNGLIKGTFDNVLTNAASLSLMLSDTLPENVIIAFTGDEEETSVGANSLIRFFRDHQIHVKHIFVLDVTEMAWKDDADYTIENDLWSAEVLGKRIINSAEKLPYTWRFVPADPDNIPDYIKEGNIIYEEAAEDESWNYDDEDFGCCSICIPVYGNMHSNGGVLARKVSLFHFVEFLNELINNCC